MPNKRVIPSESIQTIIKRYEGGESTSAISKDYACSPEAITSVLRREGVHVRGRTERPHFAPKICRHPGCSVQFIPTGRCHFYCNEHGEQGARPHERAVANWAETREELTHPCPICGQPIVGVREAHPGRCARLLAGNKRCWRCRKPKALDEFHSDASRGDGLDPICRDCHNHMGRIDRLVLRERVLVKYGSRCQQCGEDDPEVLEIDHVEGGGHTERQAIRSPYTYAKKVLDDATGTYQLLCANCHRKKTRQEGSMGGRGRSRKTVYDAAVLHQLKLRTKTDVSKN